MDKININGKELPVPSFFQVMNYGGGYQDKTREVVYADLTSEVPLLLNYFYINNEYEYTFHSRYFDNIEKFDTIGDLFNDIRKNMIQKDKNIEASYPPVDYDFNKRVILLDSGAANIVKQIAKEANYNKGKFSERLIEDMIRYYEFANKYKFDIVVGFDLGGKYTFKAGETKDKALNDFYDSLEKDAINFMLMEKSVEYLKSVDNYFPKVLATIHGRTPDEYKEYTQRAVVLEENEQYNFWGFALGGIASSSGMDDLWYADIDFSGTNKRNMKNAVTPAKAAKIVRSIVGNRPIHALGCGGYVNIPMNYYFGATSFDAQSPARRVGDGNDASVEYLYSDTKPSSAKFSKLLLGGYDNNLNKMEGKIDYFKICDVKDDYELCGCAACRYVEYMSRLKELYGDKQANPEAHYLSRQIMNTHSINMHTQLCELVAKYDSFNDFINNNENELNDQLAKIHKQIDLL